LGAERILSVDDPNAALCGQELGREKEFDTTGKSPAYLHRRKN
jgi:hypothetical protein